MWRFQFDRLGCGLCWIHSDRLSAALQLPAGSQLRHRRVLGPHPHRVHHRGLGLRDQGQDQLPGGAPQVLLSAAPHA